MLWFALDWTPTPKVTRSLSGPIQPFSALFALFLIAMLGLLSAESSPAFEFDNTLESEISEVGLGKEETLLRENHFGEVWEKGVNFQSSLLSRFSWDDRLTLVIEPIVLTPRDGRKVYFRKGYIRLVLFNVALKVGRDSLWWGPGEHGALLLTNNAFPFDLIEIGTDQPFSLPWVLQRLGTFAFDVFLTRLDQYRDYDYANLFGLRFMYNPIPGLALGASRVVIFNGNSVPSDQRYSFADMLHLYFSSSANANHLYEFQIVSVDASLSLPISIQNHRWISKFYVEFGGMEETVWVPTKHAWITGLTLGPQAGARPWKLVMEYAQDHVDNAPDVWYSNIIYTTGYTYRGQIIGHHMGRDANDLFTQLSFPVLANDQARIFGEREGSWTAPPFWRIRIGGGFDHLLYPTGPWVFIEPLVDYVGPLAPGGPRSWNEVVTAGARYRF